MHASKPTRKELCETLLPQDAPWSYAKHIAPSDFKELPPHQVLMTKDLLTIHTEYQEIITRIEMIRELLASFPSIFERPSFVVIPYGRINYTQSKYEHKKMIEVARDVEKFTKNRYLGLLTEPALYSVSWFTIYLMKVRDRMRDYPDLVGDVDPESRVGTFMRELQACNPSLLADNVWRTQKEIIRIVGVRENEIVIGLTRN